jgi:hypothetical protein
MLEQLMEFYMLVKMQLIQVCWTVSVRKSSNDVSFLGLYFAAGHAIHDSPVTVSYMWASVAFLGACSSMVKQSLLLLLLFLLLLITNIM